MQVEKYKTISQLIADIKNEIPLPNDWEAMINLPKDSFFVQWAQEDDPEGFWHRSHNLHISSLKSNFAQSYKTWRTSAWLVVFLRNNDEILPDWYDKRDVEWFKKSRNAHEEVEHILIAIARYFKKVVMAHYEGRVLDCTDINYPRSNDWARLGEIGFDRNEWHDFLGKIKYESSFQSIGDLANQPYVKVIADHFKKDGEISGAVLNENFQDRRDSGEKIGIENPLQETLTDQVPIGNETSTPIANKTTHHLEVENRRHPLRFLIRSAQTSVADPYDYESIWFELVLLAKGNPPPRPMLGFVERNGIKFLDGNYEKFYTEDLLRKYVVPNARGTKKKKS